RWSTSSSTTRRGRAAARPSARSVASTAGSPPRTARTAAWSSRSVRRSRSTSSTASRPFRKRFHPPQRTTNHISTHTTAPPKPITVNQAALLLGLVLAVIAFQLNATMLNPAVEQMQHELGATTAQIGYATALFFLSKAIFQVFMPRLSDMAGRRRILFVSLGLLVVGTVIAMLAPSVEWLYVGRLIQGACGPVFTIALLTLREAASSEKEYGTKLGLVIAINGGVAGVDVILGGWMADQWGFRSILAFA